MLPSTLALTEAHTGRSSTSSPPTSHRARTRGHPSACRSHGQRTARPSSVASPTISSVFGPSSHNLPRRAAELCVGRDGRRGRAVVLSYMSSTFAFCSIKIKCSALHMNSSVSLPVSVRCSPVNLYYFSRHRRKPGRMRYTNVTITGGATPVSLDHETGCLAFCPSTFPITFDPCQCYMHWSQGSKAS